jgi:hypothetical protein
MVSSVTFVVKSCKLTSPYEFFLLFDDLEYNKNSYTFYTPQMLWHCSPIFYIFSVLEGSASMIVS